MAQQTDHSPGKSVPQCLVEKAMDKSRDHRESNEAMNAGQALVDGEFVPEKVNEKRSLDDSDSRVTV
jgi:hypothetical protein